MTKVSIVVPVYGDWPSLSRNIASLKKYHANDGSVQVHYVNDHGPEAEELEKKIKNDIQGIDNFHYYANDKNLGFVRNCNNAVMNIVDQDDDIVLLNSDTSVTKNWLSRLQEVLYSDPHIAAVNPRSNNAGTFGGITLSVPSDGSLFNRPKESYEFWKKLIKKIPATYDTLALSGFCLLIKRSVINEVGLFDEAYENGYFDDNDLSMRIYKAGYRGVIVNGVYIFHDGSKSFSDAYRIGRSAINQRIFLERYPDYIDLAKTYAIHEPTDLSRHLVWRSVNKLWWATNYLHDHGMTNTLKAGVRRARSRPYPQTLTSDQNVATAPKVKVWTHELSDTGAPLTLIDFLRQWVKNDPSIVEELEIWHPEGSFISDNAYASLIDMGIKPPISNGVFQARFNKGDIIVLNSSAYSMWFFDDLLTNLENDTIAHVFWYIHENSHMYTGAFWDFDNLRPHSKEENDRYRSVKQRLQHFIRTDKMTIYYPSANAKKNWVEWLETSRHQHVSPVRISVPESELHVRGKVDFDTIDFVIAGSVTPYKGQLSVVDALVAFHSQFYVHNPSKYRKFSLNVVGIDDNYQNYYNTAVVNAADSLPKRFLKLHKKGSQAKAHGLIKAANLTITYSSVESFSLVTMEGMAYGHPIIRSESSGQQEQLQGNGWGVSTHDFGQLVRVIEEVLNKSKTTNNTLAVMSERSVELARKNIRSKYRIIRDVESYLHDRTDR